MMTAERQVLRNDMSIMKQVRLIGLVQLLVLLLPAIASACPGCSEGLDGNLIRGSDSIGWANLIPGGGLPWFHGVG